MRKPSAAPDAPEMPTTNGGVAFAFIASLSRSQSAYLGSKSAHGAGALIAAHIAQPYVI